MYAWLTAERLTSFLREQTSERTSRVTLHIASAWRQFLIELEFAKNYPMAYSVAHGGVAPRNPVLDEMLPSLLHIKAVAILDAALKDLLDQNELSVPRSLGSGLWGRITFLASREILKDTERLHQIRESRNDVSHEFAQKVSWKQLDEDVASIQVALEAHQYVKSRPSLSVMAERSAARESTTPGVSFAFDYRFCVKEGDKVAAEITWTERVHSDDG